MAEIDSNTAIHEHRNASSDTSSEGLLTRLASDVSDLVTTELKLARTEISQSVDDAKTGAISFLTGVVVLLPGTVLLLLAVVLILAQVFGMQLWLATLIIGAIVTASGVIMVINGKKKLSVDGMTPEKTQAALRKDKQMIEEKIYD